MSAPVTNLTQTVQLSQCEISTALSSSAVSRITRLQATYRNLIKSGAKGSDAWDTWVRDVLSDTSGAGEAATELHTYLVRGNALKACAKAYKDRWDGTYDGTRTLNYSRSWGSPCTTRPYGTTSTGCRPTRCSHSTW